MDATWNHRRIELPQGAFETNLGNMRVTYNFTPSIFVQSLVQYNDRTRRWSTNVRFNWQQNAAKFRGIRYERAVRPVRSRGAPPDR